MAKQEGERVDNIGEEQSGHPTPEDVFKSFVSFGEKFQEIKERQNPKLLSIEGSINGECELSNGRVAEITWTRNHEIYSPETGFTSGWIIVADEDLRTQGIRRIGYKFAKVFNEDGNSTTSIIKTTLRKGESIASGKPLSAGDSQELGQLSALIKELSVKFTPLPETNKVVFTAKEAKVPNGSILGPLMGPLRRIIGIK